MMGALVTFFAVGLFTLVVAAIVLAVVGTIFSALFGVAGFLLFKVVPLVLLGWIILKLLERRRSHRALSAADRDWLEGGR